MNEVIDTGKCVICSATALVVAMGVAVGGLAVVLNVVKAVLF